MSAYGTNTTLREVGKRLRAAKSIMVTTHARPDGDAVGSVLALARALAGIRKRVDAFLIPHVAENLMSLVGDTPVQLVENNVPADNYDLIVITDTGAESQLQPLTEWLRSRRQRAIILDHHVHGDDLATLKIVEPTCASTTQLIVRLLDVMGIEISGGPNSIAEALLLGIATDTGWFKFDNADAEAFRVAARLIDAGADKSRIYSIVEESDGPERLAILGRTVSSIEYAARGRAAIMTVTPEDFRETGADPEDLTGIVNEPLRIANVRVSIIISSTDGKVTKISFRSKPELRTKFGVLPAIDVNRLAQRFGGGGHAHAAGARVEKGIEVVKKELIEVLESELNSARMGVKG